VEKKNQNDLLNLALYDNNDLIISSLDSDIIELLRTNLSLFFAITNFGQRSSKGFGSFSVTKIDNAEIKWNPKEYLPEYTQLMKFPISGDDFEKQILIFRTLDFYWKCLKSGINYSIRRAIKKDDVKITQRAYIKSFLWKYLNDKNFTWEKRKIKQTFSLETPYLARNLIENDKEAIFARALLGLPDKFEYRIPLGTTYLNYENKLKENIDQKLVSIKHDENNKEKLIERISSPIIFKPIITEDTVSVYIIFDTSHIEYLNTIQNKKFRFTCNENNELINIAPNVINYTELITKFHFYLWKDKEAASQIFKNSIFKMEEDRKFKFIPRDFSWENILGKNKNRVDNCVVFQIIKNK